MGPVEDGKIGAEGGGKHKAHRREIHVGVQGQEEDFKYKSNHAESDGKYIARPVDGWGRKHLPCDDNQGHKQQQIAETQMYPTGGVGNAVEKDLAVFAYAFYDVKSMVGKNIRHIGDGVQTEDGDGCLVQNCVMNLSGGIEDGEFKKEQHGPQEADGKHGKAEQGYIL